nr:MAT1-1-5 [Drepanopeziza brunnea f. sp. 'monogermtubi']
MSDFADPDASMHQVNTIKDDWFSIPGMKIEAVTDEDIRAQQYQQPYSEDFVKKIIRDFIRHVYYSHCLLLKSVGMTSCNISLANMDAVSVKKGLRTIMAQCRALRDAPELFPTDTVKTKFLCTVALLADVMVSIEENRLQIFILKQQAFSPILDMRQPFTEEATSKNIEYPIPQFLPDKFNGRNPWNNWLDNSAQPTAGWTAIQQKIPKPGEKLMRQITLLYDAVEDDFDDEDQSELETQTTLEGFPEPGDAFKHMTWSGFCTVPFNDLGFYSGNRKQYDADGITTLEHLSKVLCKQYGGNGIKLGTRNCPFFRFAMAYREL